VHEAGAFLGLLRGARIEAVADVRRYPSSRRMPWFNAGALEELLSAAGIEYHHFEELGGRRPGGFAGYADYMASKEFGEGVEGLLRLAGRRRTAVMCAEADWRSCHRRLLSDALAAGGHEVVHIGRRGALESHQPVLA
jgi:uncharacterized protein (DUF488 family)